MKRVIGFACLVLGNYNKYVETLRWWEDLFYVKKNT